MADELTTIPFGELVLDYAVYPRHEIDKTNVRALADAMEAGQQLPPVVADRRTKRLSDGFHRFRAMERIGTKPTQQVSVILRDYETEADLFADAIRLNAGHGKRLTPYDVAVVSVRAQELGLSREAVANLLSITAKRLEELTSDRMATTVTREPVIVKRSIRHLAGTQFTERQAQVNERLSGWSPRFHARQLLMVIESDMLDTSDAEMMGDLSRLREALNSMVVPA